MYTTFGYTFSCQLSGTEETNSIEKGVMLKVMQEDTQCYRPPFICKVPFILARSSFEDALVK